ncbi:MAG: hypothetical protein IJX28_09215 [Clostridia bacterium]|nr:hypothetical protein [Clostridia bacterium]
MDFSKLFAILASFLLVICLTLALTTLTVLRNTVEEAKQTKEEAVEAMSRLDQAMDQLEETVTAGNFQSPGELPSDKNEEPISPTVSFCIREANEKIAILNSEGHLIYLLEISPALLPREDREALQEGISISSWAELFSWIQSYSN